MSESLFAFGLGVGTQNQKGAWLEVFYPEPVLQPDASVVKALKAALGYSGGNHAIELDAVKLAVLGESAEQAGATELASLASRMAGSCRPLVATILEKDEQPASVAEGYLKLQLLSHRLVKPHGQVLAGIFAVLPNVAWTNQGAIDLDELPERQLQARLKGELLEVNSVDKFPKMTDYVVPKGVRVADAARIRLGAYLGEGTTVMHEGFVNFNAGTEGTAMIEGRISAGVFVGNASDLGGGCSTMGTLSGGNSIVISVGKECLIGANAGIGIPLGDRCKVEAGLYITAGSVVAVIDDQGKVTGQVKARELSGQSDLLFRRNSRTGAIECLTNKSAIELNAALHAHN